MTIMTSTTYSRKLENNPNYFFVLAVLVMIDDDQLVVIQHEQVAMVIQDEQVDLENSILLE